MSLSEGELQMSVEVKEVNEESIAKILLGPINSCEVVDESMHVDFGGDQGGDVQAFLSSTLVKTAIGSN